MTGVIRMSLLQKIKGKREEIKISRAGNTRAYKFKQGKTYISILPLHSDLHLPVAEQGIYRSFGMHYIKNAKGENVVAVGDRGLCFEGEVCVVREGLLDTLRYANSIGDEDLAEQTKASLARPNYLMNIAVHKDPDGKAEDHPQLANFSESLAEQLFSILEEYLVTSPEDVTRLNDRLVFIVEREGTTKNDTKYKLYPAPSRETIKEDFVKKAVNLDEYVQAQFQDSVQKALTYIANVTGKPVSGTALAAALTTGRPSTPAIAAPVTVASDDDDLLAAASADRIAEAPALAHAVAEDAVFEDVLTPAPSPTLVASNPAPTPAASDDLLAEIDALAA